MRGPAAWSPLQRPEANARALPDLISEGLGFHFADSVRSSDLSEAELRTREQVAAVVTNAIRVFLNNGIDAAVAQLNVTANVSPEDSLPVFQLLGTISRQLETNSEIESLLRALRGEYIEPGPGADIVQNPAILPTGRNTHAINPYAVPSEVAYTRAELVQRVCSNATSASMDVIRARWRWCCGVWTTSRRRVKAWRRLCGCWACGPCATR